MADGICRVHNTPLNGFGSLVFCNACEAGTEMQSDGFLDLIDVEEVVEYGYIVSAKKWESNEISLGSCDAIRLKKPNLNLVNGFVYRMSLEGMQCTPTADGRFVYPDTTYIGITIEEVK